MKYIKGKLRTLIFYVKWTSLFFLLGAICLNGLFIKQSFGGSQGVQMHQVTQEEIRLVLSEYILDRGPWEEGSVKIQGISYFGLLPQLPLGYTYEVHSALTSSLLKLTPFTISFSLNEKVIKRLSVNAEIEIIEDVLISSRPLNRKHVIGPEDLYMGKRNMVGQLGNFISDLDAAVGMRVKRALKANTPLTFEILEQNPVIQRGDLVQIITESSGFRISASGKALEKGYLGKQIQVMNTNSKKRVYGRVMNSETVKLDY